MKREREAKTDQPARIGRRDALKVLGAAPAAAMVAITPAAARETAQAMAMPPRGGAAPAAAGPYQPRALDPREYRLLGVLAEWIIPPDERSAGANAAGVPACVDDWLAQRRGRWLDEIRGGFLWLDIEARRQFGHDFADCATAQQKQLLDRIAWPDRATIDDANAAAFFNRLRDAVVSAFFSSKIGVADLGYMGNTMVAHWQGCPDAVLARLDVSYEQSQWRVPFPGRGQA